MKRREFMTVYRSAQAVAVSGLLGFFAGCSVDDRMLDVAVVKTGAGMDADPLQSADSGVFGDATAEPDAMIGTVTQGLELTEFVTTPLPADVPDCAENQPYYGKDPKLTIFNADTEFGTGQWMQGTSGSCDGMQWIQFEVEAPLPGPLELRYVTADGIATGVGYRWPEGLEVGTHFGPTLKDPQVICGHLALPGEPVPAWPVFGNQGRGEPRPNLILGTMC